MSNITIEKSQLDPAKEPWWWIGGDTYPHRDLLKRHGARFSGRRKAWYWIGHDLPAAIQALADETTEDSLPQAPIITPDLESQIMHVLAKDDAQSGAQPEFEPTPEAERPAIRVTRPTPLPHDETALDDVQRAILETKHQPSATSFTAPSTNGRLQPIQQAYCGELTGSITGQVFCYGYAVHEGVCVYVNMGGPRVSVEAIRAKLGKGDIVTLIPDDAPSLELTAGEGNSGMYRDYLQTIPEARFTSLILLHDWVINPNYNGAATTFILRTDEAQAKLKQHVAQLVNLPVFDGWTAYLWHAGKAAMLVRPTHLAEGIDLLTVSLDADAWTRLITGGVEQRVIALPEI